MIRPENASDIGALSSPENILLICVARSPRKLKASPANRRTDYARILHEVK